jgi:HEAT repeat protein
MNATLKTVFIVLALSTRPLALAQSDEAESLKIIALEALVSAPPERALPIVSKVLKGSGSDELKERALFVLSQIELPEARALLIETARTGNANLREEAIRSIGIDGDPTLMAELAGIYASGDEDTKEAVLDAYVIADYVKGVYDIAVSTQDPEEFEDAVEKLGAMDARDELRSLRDRAGSGEALIHAYAVAGDVESLTELARDGSNPERQAQAMQGLGIAGGDAAGSVLLEVYRSSDVEDVKEAALQGLMIADDDRAILELYRASNDAAEKRELLETLVNMESDEVWNIIDTTLEDGQ